MIRLVETYGEVPVRVNDQEFFAPALLEDDEGLRYLVIPYSDPPIIIDHHWVQATQGGVFAVVQCGAFGVGMRVIRAEQVERVGKRSDQTRQWEVPVQYWRDIGRGLLVGEVVAEGPKAHNKLVHLHAHSDFCLAPENRVVTADLAWKSINDVEVGEELIDFDEDLRSFEGERGNSRSKMRRTVVEKKRQVVRDCYRISLANGAKIIASAQHGWVVNGTTRGSLIYPSGPPSGYGPNTRRWMTTEELQSRKTHHGRQIWPSMILWAEPWDDVPTEKEREAAWLAGIADGEGWMHAGQFSFGQNPGLVWDEVNRVCKELGYEHTEDRLQSKQTPYNCRTFRLQGYATVARFLSQCRPVRFANRTDECWVGRRAGGRYTRPVPVVGLEPLGERETIALQTSTKTFVAEGFLSHNSALDGFSKVDEMIALAKADDQPALALTDHGTAAGHPTLQIEADKAGIKPIFGLEAYLVADRFCRPIPKIAKPSDEEKAAYAASLEKARHYNHLILWAETNQGLSNLWGANTQANRDGFYAHPRLDYETLATFNEGLMCSTGCLRGPLSEAILLDDEELAIMRLGALMNLFPDRCWIELHTNSLADQKRVNHALVGLAHRFSLPTIAVCDSHYPCAEDKATHGAWMAMQTNKEIQDEADMFAEDQNYHLMSTEEVRQSLSYLGDVADEAIANTAAVAERCQARLEGKRVAPSYSGSEQTDRDEMWRVMSGYWDSRVKPKIRTKADLETYSRRVETELDLILDKNMAGYFLIVAGYCRRAREKGILIGPGRGSGGGSLVAYLTGITNVDPIKYGLFFERFMTPGRASLPDFDVDFPASRRADVEEDIIGLYGEDHVIRVGTHQRLKNKGVIQNVARILKSEEGMSFLDSKEISEIIEKAESTTAGKGLSWEELMATAGGELASYVERYPRLFDLAAKMVGRLKTYGKHAAGLCISTDTALIDRLPLRVTKSDDGRTQMVAEWDMEALESFGLLKFDILTLSTLDTIQRCMDLIEEQGTHIDPNDWTTELEDPEVWDMLCAGNTLGVFQIETSDGTRFTKRVKPRSIEDLAVVITIMRPGPKDSGLTETYLKRRFGQEEPDYPDPRLESVLSATYGCMIFQEDIMNACVAVAGYTLLEADMVRKILGKKQTDKVEEESRKFIPAAVERGMTKDAATRLWDQMAQFARYSFNRAHAVEYAILGMWCAWFKYHYPLEFLAAKMATVDKDRLPDFIENARALGIRLLPPDINAPRFRPERADIRYGLEGVKNIGPSAMAAIEAHSPYTSWEDFAHKRPAKADVTRLLAAVGAFDTLHPNRAELEARLAWEAAGLKERCAYQIDSLSGPGGLPCGYDWANDPQPVYLKSGKLKAPPKRCTKVCQHYSPSDWNPLGARTVEPYSPADIRAKEREHLGVYLSSTPFDDSDVEAWQKTHTAAQLEGLPNGDYYTIGLIRKLRKSTDRHGNNMAFIGVQTKEGSLDLPVFAERWARDKELLKIAEVPLIFHIRKTTRGYQYIEMATGTGGRQYA